MKPHCRYLSLLLGLCLAEAWFPSLTCAGITNLSEWTLVEDPSHPNFTSSLDSQSQITLSATAGPIPAGTDIGYQSVDGVDVAGSSSGWAFDPAYDFSVAADFDLSFGSPTGGFSLGLGIGEDRSGTDSAGLILASLDGILSPFAGAARVNDVTQAPFTIGVAGQPSGRLLVSYEAASGDVTLGVSTNGDDTPEGTGTFGGIQNSWDDEALLVSFFARGDNGLFNWDSGTADAVFSDFRVISGTPFSVAERAAVPEPSSLPILGLAMMFLAGYVRRQRRKSASTPRSVKLHG